MKRLLLVLGLSFAWDYPGAFAAPANSKDGATSSAPRNASLAKIFRRGVEAYEQKRYDAAIEAFQQILKQNDHTGTKVYLARSYYQQKNITEALKIFRSLDVKSLDPDAAYEYGQAAYRSGDNESAVKAFGQVPNGHAMYDLAGYYGGIAAFKMKEYQRAMDLLDQAVVLPSKLVRSQKLYRQEAEKKLFQKQKEEILGDSGSSGGKSGKKEPPPPPPVPFIYAPTSSFGLQHKYTNQTSEAKKGKSEDIDMQRTTLRLAYGSERPQPTDKTQVVYVADLSFATVKDNALELNLLSSPEDLLESTALEAHNPNSLIRTELAAGYEAAIGNISTIGVVGGAYAFAADGSYAEKLHYAPYLSIFLSQTGDTIETLLSIETHPKFNSDKLLLTHTVQNGSFTLNLNKSVFTRLIGQLNEYSYNASRLNGPDWNGRVQLELGLRKTKTLTLTLGGFYEIAQGWRVYDVAQELPLVKFNLGQSGGYVKAEINFTPWWNFGFRGLIVQNSYANVLPEPADNVLIPGEVFVDENLGTAISQFSLYSGITLTF